MSEYFFNNNSVLNNLNLKLIRSRDMDFFQD